LMPDACSKPRSRRVPETMSSDDPIASSTCLDRRYHHPIARRAPRGGERSRPAADSSPFPSRLSRGAWRSLRSQSVTSRTVENDVSSALRRYELELERRGAAGHLAPGLDSGAIDAAEEFFGFALPEDARAVWSWHNGTVFPNSTTASGRSLIVPGYHFLALDGAVTNGAKLVEVGQIFEQAHIGTTRWVTLCAGNDPVVIDATDPSASTATTLMLLHDEGTAVVDAISVAERVELWIEAIVLGAWTPEPDGRWATDESKMTDRMRAILRS
jgi:cell wall assembly regulator SMI1